MVTKVAILRQPISNGKESLYLSFYPPIEDISTGKRTYRETLGIYIYQNPKNKAEKEYNDEMLMKAEGIRSIKVQRLIDQEYGFTDKYQLRENFLEYFRKVALRRHPKWMITYKHFEKFTNGKCDFQDVNIDLCRKFMVYLQNTKQLRHTNKRVSQNSAATYFTTFRTLLRQAFEENKLPKDLSDNVSGIKEVDTRREFLTLEELQTLVNTPCDIPILKRASLFSCLTGLRLGDIIELDWENIQPSSDGGYWMRIRTQKSKTEATLPLGEDALRLCGVRGSGKVFHGLTKSMTQYSLKKWLVTSGINKHITFHCFRHTFATLQLSLGTDIYTVSKLLTHKNLYTTQVYANIVDEKKREAANRISLQTGE